MRVAVAVVGLGLLACGGVGRGQSAAGCGSAGYRVVARRWDAVLEKGWEVRQDCAHPEWPARAVAVSGVVAVGEVVVRASEVVAPRPLLVRAGERVRLWERDAVVRIEMSGVAEASARAGERVMVRVTRQTEDAGLATEDVAGTVRGVGDVEMER